MLKVRLIPTILLKDGRMIKTRQFSEYRDVGNPRTVAKVYDAQRADELIFLDITATVENRHFLFDIIAAVAQECFMPLTVGGGIRDVAQARAILTHGADKVAINTAAVERPAFITELAKKFGNSTVVVSIDYKKNAKGKNEVFTHRGTHPTGLDPVAWAKEAQKLGAGEILLTCVDREGMMTGYDLETLKQITSSVSIPVTASGGVGTIQDLVDGIVIGGASAVAAASIFHFTDQSIFKAHSHMKQKGLSVRK
ncbi:imidazole glycerol phosphate synthase subunit HisF [Candidatus Peribacteria bacterium RIFCSPHIGHO2_02_FULL_53_20]|nr:MAG: imidazole glycerol phosphate synthase subunit HisF [Candidatus Peribacteria bacterium RIFCSPHIGHO2_02_FULL_53_20]